jgi:hypothetical protein
MNLTEFPRKGNFLMPFVDPPINTYFERAYLSDPGNCSISDVVGYFIANATFLRDVNAVFAGWENIVDLGSYLIDLDYSTYKYEV